MSQDDDPAPTLEQWQVALMQEPVIIEDRRPRYHEQDNADMLVNALVGLSPRDIIRLRKRLGRVMDEESTDFLQKFALDVATVEEERVA